MSLPGLELSQPTVEAQRAPAAPVQHILSKDSEWRFEVAFGNSVKVKLLSGTAELFGTELALSQTYTFSGTKAAIYTWHGCTLEVTEGESVATGVVGSAPVPPGSGSGGCQVEYTAEETPMIDYTMRDEAKAQGRGGPRVLIVGPEDAGKTSLAKILTGYATKMGRQPFVINLDPSEGMLSVPGTLTATAFRTLIDVEQGWGSSPLSGPTPIPVKLPLVYFYGLQSPLNGGEELYKSIVSRLALTVAGRLAEDEEAKEAGIIVDTPGEISQGKGGGEDIINHIVTEFSISTILVLGSERLYSTMVKNYDGKPTSTASTAPTSDEKISVVKLSKSGGCVDRDEFFMKSTRESQVRSYFFGTSAPSTASSALSSSTAPGSVISLSPHGQHVDFDSLSIYSITINNDEYDGMKQITNSTSEFSFLPGGSNDNGEDEIPSTSTALTSGPSSTGLPFQQIPLKKLVPSSDSPVPQALENTLLAITHAPPNAPLNEIRDASIMGFLYVAGVDSKKAKLRLLSPVAGRVPARAIIWGNKWPGEVLGLVG
ncbi:pre-mRNA cleavage complex II protein Clp1 [Microsporum canis CBS 113480]|uniref:Polynucleotide 5'-hydroxyl-kinase GRC3 n=1 Tax=Arthroderma otae (strain ATCC MYA-4605 / CBS 113480) TaxID=554155 RepID=C5FJJ7_ARTOC|nr:pre-mRNA cleavage complex II protein Clp1 [Microsporum canis CBS 113480]EEQ30858.1 pre-mRNA cleavage complex II protein Clp1 [Microsporum canis CBS 113480]